MVKINDSDNVWKTLSSASGKVTLAAADVKKVTELRAEFKRVRTQLHKKENQHAYIRSLFFNKMSTESATDFEDYYYKFLPKEDGYDPTISQFFKAGQVAFLHRILIQRCTGHPPLQGNRSWTSSANSNNVNSYSKNVECMDNSTLSNFSHISSGADRGGNSNSGSSEDLCSQDTSSSEGYKKLPVEPQSSFQITHGEMPTSGRRKAKLTPDVEEEKQKVFGLAQYLGQDLEVNVSKIQKQGRNSAPEILPRRATSANISSSIHLRQRQKSAPVVSLHCIRNSSPSSCTTESSIQQDEIECSTTQDSGEDGIPTDKRNDTAKKGFEHVPLNEGKVVRTISASTSRNQPEIKIKALETEKDSLSHQLADISMKLERERSIWKEAEQVISKELIKVEQHHDPADEEWIQSSAAEKVERLVISLERRRQSAQEHLKRTQHKFQEHLKTCSGSDEHQRQASEEQKKVDSQKSDVNQTMLQKSNLGNSIQRNRPRTSHPPASAVQTSATLNVSPLHTLRGSQSVLLKTGVRNSSGIHRRAQTASTRPSAPSMQVSSVPNIDFTSKQTTPIRHKQVTLSGLTAELDHEILWHVAKRVTGDWRTLFSVLMRESGATFLAATRQRLDVEKSCPGSANKQAMEALRRWKGYSMGKKGAQYRRLCSALYTCHRKDLADYVERKTTVAT